MSFNNSVSDTLRKSKEDIEDGPSQILLKSQNKGTILSKPVVIPSAVNMSGTRKLAKHKGTNETEEEYLLPKQTMTQEENTKEQDIPLIEGLDDFDEVEEIPEKKVEPAMTKEVDTIDLDSNQEELKIEGLEEIEVAQPVKRGRGRPRKNPVPVVDPNKPKRGRGRPRKNPIPELEESELPQEEMILPGLETQEIEKEDDFLPGFSDIDEIIEPKIQEELDEEEVQKQSDSFLPGFEEDILEETKQKEMVLPGLDEAEEVEIERETIREEAKVETKIPEYYQDRVEMDEETELQQSYEEIDITNLLTADKKIATFVGTSKNGTSFIVNNVAELLSSMGVNVAILDTTKNRNSYYIYTKNEEPLREIATHCIEKLAQGIAEGIKVNQ